MKNLLFLMLFLFGMNAQAEYAVVVGMYSPSEGCIFYLTEIWYEGPDGERGGGDDSHVQSGVIMGSGCDGIEPPPPTSNEFTETNAYTADITGSTSEGGCTEWAINVLDGTNIIGSGTIKICTKGKNGTALQVKPLEKYIPENKLKVYPTLAQDEITIVDYKYYTNIQIFDVNGNLVLEFKNENLQEKIDISELPEGIYIIRGHSTRGSLYSNKFIKQ